MPARRFAFFLPNTFTALNMACGFVAAILSWKGKYYEACMLLFLGSIFDSVDGRVARLTGTQSLFGEQFDSLSDLITFGMAPAFIMYNKFLSGFSRVGLIVSFIFVLCGALRLARFNANIEKVSSNFFQGLPIPAAALSIIGFVFFSLEYPDFESWNYLAVPYIVLFAALMISNIPFTSFKDSKGVKRHKKASLFIIFLVFILLFIHEQIMVGILMWTYVLSCLIYFVANKGQLEDLFKWDDEVGDEDD